MKKRVLSMLLCAVMLLSMLPAGAFAATPTVNIVSFMRGAQTDLRSSELMWAEVTGYDGNVQELTYKWTSTLGTSLYVYNTHNMYDVNNTDGEHEIYPKGGSSLGSMESHRIHEETFSGVGFAWAAIYGANLNKATALAGTVTVQVYTPDGTLLCSDSHTGTVTRRNIGSWGWPKYVYTYSGFTWYDLQSDLDHAVFGLFEGDTLDVRDLLGKSAIVHIHCVESAVTNAEIISENGDQYIRVDGSEPAYTVTGLQKGVAQIEITVTKEMCKFHEYTSGTAYPMVYVFKKPIPVPTTTTITLTPESVDPDCEYFIDGQKGEKQPDGSVLFTDLTPNTEYEIEVRAEYEDNDGDTNYVYAYVDSTTLPVYLATVNVYLDGVLTPYGQIHTGGHSWVLKSDSATVALNTAADGVYTATVENGTYQLWCMGTEHTHQVSNHTMIIENANASMDVHHYSVTYNTNGGAFADGTDSHYTIYDSGVGVNVLEQIPTKEGYAFLGWEDQDGNFYSRKQLLTASIEKPYVLEAVWTDAINVHINVQIYHAYTDADGNPIGYDFEEGKADITMDLVSRPSDSTDPYLETGHTLTLTPTDHGEHTYTSEYISGMAETVDNALYTYYTCQPAFTSVPDDFDYTLVTGKSGYNVTKLEPKKQENGDWVIDVVLEYDPLSYELDFTVEIQEDKKQFPDLFPQAVIVKVAYWDSELNDWNIITQHAGDVPGVRVDIDQEGKGSGSYVVWGYVPNTEIPNSQPYVYRTVITSFVYPDGTIVAAQEHADGVVEAESYHTDTYIALPDSSQYETADNLTETGAYFEKTNEEATQAQQIGKLHTVIDFTLYNVTFDPNGGQLNGTQESTRVENILFVPEQESYVPTREGGYVFDGWYLADENGNMTDAQVASGAVLTQDITLMAKWKDPRYVEGTVTVEGSYLYNGETVLVNDVDRASHALVILQELRDGTVYNLASQTVEITWTETDDNAYGTAQYESFIVPDDGKQYRIEVRILNYALQYQNETTAAGEYNDADYTVVYIDDPQLTFVNARLAYAPDSYYQPCEIISQAIGQGFRPQSGLAEIYYTAVNSGDPYALITQHTEPPYGAPIPVTQSTGYGYIGEDLSTYVWRERYDGVLYDYQMELSQVVDYTGAELAREDLPNAPFYVTYGPSSRYSPANDAPTGTLQAILTPKQYPVIFHLGAEDATMESQYGIYDQDGNVTGYATAHVWSYDTDLSGIVAQRPGYTFGGWYVDEECTQSAENRVAAAVAEQTDLYAKWIPFSDLVNLTVIINHGIEGGGHASNYEKTLTTQLTHDDRANREQENRVFSDLEGYTQDYANWHTEGNVAQDVFVVENYFTGLSPQYDYSVNVVLEGYYVAEKNVEQVLQSDGSTHHNVVITLNYNPEMLNLEFYVRMDESVPQLLYPVSAEVKVTSWYDSTRTEGWSWDHISQHFTTTVTVTIDPETGKGTGSYPVWMWYDETYPYHYRIAVVQLRLGDGSIVTMDETLHAITFEGSDYRATVEVGSNGTVPQIPTDGTGETDLPGIYGQETTQDGVTAYTQVDTLGAVITMDRVIFHANNQEFTGEQDIFRTYFYAGVAQPDNSGYYRVNDDGTIDAFYDIPEFAYLTHNNYIFKGWYLDADNENDSRPINWSDTYTGNVDIYAHWIQVESVDKVDDGKQTGSNSYREYDLIGAQIRDKLYDSEDHYGTVGTGLRFITVLSEDVYNQINSIHASNAAGAEYGFAVAKTATAVKYAGEDSAYTLQYKGTNVNGTDTSAAYKYVQNMKCSGVPDHFNGETYRLYTAVITYNGLSGDALTAAQATDFVARSYIRYTDANGLLRTYYNNYTGTNTYSGCSTSFSYVSQALQDMAEGLA